jgi:DNA invertase Pin-like site-specific DNA recombinase
MTTTIIGYARTSTLEQVAGFEDQKRQLETAGCTKLFHEQISSVAKERPEFAAMLAYARQGDIIVATKIDRLARNAIELLQFAKGLKDRGIGLRILGQDIDTTSTTGWFVLTIFAGLAEMERTQMLERQRIGIAKARIEKKYKGRKPTADHKVQSVMTMLAEGVRPTDVARRAGVSRATVYRLLKTAKPAADDADPKPARSIKVPSIPIKHRVPVPKLPNQHSIR